MKKLLSLILALLMTAALPAALAESAPRRMLVSGSATVALPADTATLQIGVNTRKLTVKEAQKENAEIMARVMNALKETGVEEQDIITSQFNVNTEYDYSNSALLGGETQILYYRVQNNVSVTIHDLSMIGSILDAAMDAGANTSYGISFSSTQENEAYQKALSRAVEDAMQKAMVLATASGVKLGSLITITQNTYPCQQNDLGASNYFFYAAKTADAGTAITSGDVSVSAEVLLEYEFQ